MKKVDERSRLIHDRWLLLFCTIATIAVCIFMEVRGIGAGIVSIVGVVPLVVGCIITEVKLWMLRRKR